MVWNEEFKMQTWQLASSISRCYLRVKESLMFKFKLRCFYSTQWKAVTVIGWIMRTLTHWHTPFTMALLQSRDSKWKTQYIVCFTRFDVSSWNCKQMPKRALGKCLRWYNVTLSQTKCEFGMLVPFWHPCVSLNTTDLDVDMSGQCRQYNPDPKLTACPQFS